MQRSSHIRWIAVLGLMAGWLLFSTGKVLALSNPIVEENARPGNPPSEWDLPTTGSASIQGFTTDFSVNLGQTVYFKIKTDAAAYQLKIYRMGYYGGLGARQIDTVLPTAHLPQIQPACLFEEASGLIDCGNWSASASWTVPSDAVSGIYFAKIIRPDTGAANHVFFIVRNDSSRSDIVFQTADETWQAYNYFGGNSLYQSLGTVYPLHPAKRAYKVSYNRPFEVNSRGVSRYDISWVFNVEYPMVRWLESNGFDVSYLSGIDVDRYGSLLANHKIFLSVGHDEYWSGEQRKNVEQARDRGLHMAFLSGNEVFWKTRFEPSMDGSQTPFRTLTCYKETHAHAKIDPTPDWTGTWRDSRFSPPSDGGYPENALTGTIFTVNGAVSWTNAFAVPASYGNLRFWRNTSVATAPANTVVNFAQRTLGSEWDEDLDNGFRPAGLFAVSEATWPEPSVIWDHGTNYGSGTATHKMTLYRHPGGALVFGAGNIQFAWSLDTNHWNSDFPTMPVPPADARIQQAMVNLFADMSVQPGTLQAGLVPASPSSDIFLPSSAMTSPVENQSFVVGVPVTVQGTASDAGGVVAAVEFSWDDGATWHPAQGRNNWSVTWVPRTIASSIHLKSRAVDDSGNIETPGAGVTVSVISDGLQSVWPLSIDPTLSWPGIQNQPVELGMKFKSDVDGFITGVRFYKRRVDLGAHLGNLWDPASPSSPMATGAFNNETESGWQQMQFATPVRIRANKIYIVSYFCPTGNFTYQKSGFAASGVDNPPLHALKNETDNLNGVYTAVGKSAFPSSSFGASNYWVDATFSAAPAQEGMTLWPANTVPATQAATNSGGSVELGVKFRSDVTGMVTALRFYKGPNNTGLHTGHLWDRSGKLLAEVAFGNETSQGWQQANLSQPVTIQANTTYVVSYFSPTGYFSYNSAYFANQGFDNAPLHALRDGVDGGNGVYLYTVSPAFPMSTFFALNYWVDVVFVPTPMPETTTLWPPNAVPTTHAANSNDSSVELGVKFRSDVNGTITALRFYKGPNNTGTHTGHLWDRNGNRLADVTFTNETAQGWQQANLSQPVAIQANTTYVASYFSPTGRFSYDVSYFANQGHDHAPLHALQSGVDGGNGVYLYTAGPGFPVSTYSSLNYWVDVVFTGEGQK